MNIQTLSQIKKILLAAIENAGFKTGADELHLERTKTLQHGHFTTHVAMIIGGKLKKDPRDVAKAILENLSPEYFVRSESAGPGFINLWIEQKIYSKLLARMLSDFEGYLKKELGIGKKSETAVIEYSSPNIAKPLGAHHLLSTIIGESLKRIYKAYGYRVWAENYPGDLGTQFGKLMVAIKKWGDGDAIRKNPIEELLKLYVRFHDEAEKDPRLEDEARAEYRRLEEGDSVRRRQWRRIVDWSFQDIQPLYDRLDISFDGIHGESFFEDRMRGVLKEGRDRKLFVDGKDGAWIVSSNNPDEPPAVVRKSDGATLYLTRDLAQMDFFEETYHPELVAWVVDTAQSFYFKQRFEVYRKLRKTQTQFIHVVFGRMDFKDGGMSTRKGNIILLSELLDEAEARALRLIEEKKTELDSSGKKKLARAMGIGSVKYSILHQNRLSNITFDWDKMLSLEGNSAPYLMYTVARLKSVFRKAELNPEDVSLFELVLSDDKETRVVLDLLAYPGVLERAAREFKPSLAAHFLYELAQDFNALYNDLPILQAETALRNSRLLIAACALRLMEEIFGLLGLEAPERM